MGKLEARLEIRLSAVMRAQLEAQAARRGWSAAMFTREAIRTALEADLDRRTLGLPPRRRAVS
jgi:hypothetical protein